MTTRIEDGYYLITKEQFLHQEFPEGITAGDDIRIPLGNGYCWDILGIGIASFRTPSGCVVLSVYDDDIVDPIFGNSKADLSGDWLSPLEDRYFAHQTRYDAVITQNPRLNAEPQSQPDGQNGNQDDEDDADRYF